MTNDVDTPPAQAHFNGPDYDPERDDERLHGQLLRVWQRMRDGEWRSLAQIEKLTGDPQASISAQLRHLRKARFGARKVSKRYVSDGLFEYRVTKE